MAELEKRRDSDARIGFSLRHIVPFLCVSRSEPSAGTSQTDPTDTKRRASFRPSAPQAADL
jgi:hypothetical protein